MNILLDEENSREPDFNLNNILIDQENIHQIYVQLNISVVDQDECFISNSFAVLKYESIVL